MSDTPRTEAEVNRQKCWSDDIITVDANFACQLERELNAANESFRKLNIHALDLAARIQRLEDAGDALKAAGYFGGWADAVNKWVKIREGKP